MPICYETAPFQRDRHARLRTQTAEEGACSSAIGERLCGQGAEPLRQARDSRGFFHHHRPPMDAFDHLHHDLRTAHPELCMFEGLVEENRCLDLELAPTRFLLGQLREWRGGIVVHARLGRATDEVRLMREALSLNADQATRHEPIYALDEAVLLCRYRLPFAQVHAHTLVHRLQRVAEQHRAWLEAGWLVSEAQELCA
jgi:hypothetical protein